MFRNYQFKNINYRLIIAVILLTTIGILVIGSANADYQNRQITGLILGMVVLTFFTLFDFEILLQFHWYFYGLTIGLLMAVLLFGDDSKGATRWLDIGIRFQPSEIGKIFLVLFFAWFLTTKSEELNKRKTILELLFFAAIPLLLILKEPDLSTTIVTFMVIVSVVYCAGLSRKIFLPILLVVIPLIIIYLMVTYQTKTTPFLSEYQGVRILAWMFPNDYPGSSYQQQNSIMAIGSGQLLGKGLNNNNFDSVKNGNYISEPQTDFIFAVAGEEIGFVGAAIIIVLLLIIVLECLYTSKKAKSLAGELICIGIACIIGYQSFVNICVVTGLMPNTGLTLPFVSYGLTSLVTLYMGICIVLNVGLQAKKYQCYTSYAIL